MEVDFASIISGGGVSIGTFVAGLLYKAYQKWAKESELRGQLITAQLHDLKDQKQHRVNQVAHWGTTVGHYDDTMQHRAKEESALKKIATDMQELRIRAATGANPLTPQDIPVSVG